MDPRKSLDPSENMADNIREPHQVDLESHTDHQSEGVCSMTMKPINQPTDERNETRPDEQTGTLQSVVSESRRNVRPEVIKAFNARWKYNESGCRLLADR